VEELKMPKVSKDSAAHVDQHGPVEDRHEDIDGYTVNFVSFGVDIDGTPLLKGLPGDACPCPHWGYVLKGRLTYRMPRQWVDPDQRLERLRERPVLGELVWCGRAHSRSSRSARGGSDPFRISRIRARSGRRARRTRRGSAAMDDLAGTCR
jgi:hypothetical protein